jgi:hypothetical protein
MSQSPFLTTAYIGPSLGEPAGLALDRVDLLRRTMCVDRQLVEVGGTVHFGPPSRGGNPQVTMPAGLVERLAVHFVSPAVRTSGLAFPRPKSGPPPLERRPSGHVERRLRERLDALGPAPRFELLRFLLLPELEGAERIGNPAEDVNVRRELPFD